jgi:hypothetical protein
MRHHRILVFIRGQALDSGLSILTLQRYQLVRVLVFHLALMVWQSQFLTQPHHLFQLTLGLAQVLELSTPILQRFQPVMVRVLLSDKLTKGKS